MATKILLKNSVVKDKVPAAADISIGEVCVGAHQDSPMLIFKDALDNIITITPGGGVESINGQTGVVTLTAADVGAITAADVGDGIITIEKADGTVVGDFTVNQLGDKTITLPAEVVPGDGGLTIKDSDGNTLGTFTANQATGSDVEVTLPAPPAVYWDRTGTTLTPVNTGDEISVAKVTSTIFDLDSLPALV